ncbi:Large ribosomal subunit protein eL36 - like 3 [Theobroma cacao]|nr:Large ribosomal subunit protein eL36 - like 3 [Theobroma cacao]
MKSKAIMRTKENSQMTMGLDLPQQGQDMEKAVVKIELAPRHFDKNGQTNKKDKRALEVAKRKLSTHKRAKKKREEMSSILRKMRSVGDIVALIFQPDKEGKKGRV